jgi:hypothetical protein
MGLLVLAAASQAGAAPVVTLSLVASFPRGVPFNGPFGLAFDGTNIHWSEFNGTIHEMTTAGVDTGNTTTNPLGWSALAWSGTQLVASSGTTVTFFDRYTALNQTSVTVTGTSGFSLIDGLDFDHNEIWYSPDVGNVYRRSAAGAPVGLPDPLLGGGGGFSGIERVDVGANTFLIDVNDASSPRKLDIRQLDGTLLGQATLVNDRYEDLAFDGRYLYAADFYGAKIDKIDLLVDGGSIFQPGIPEPGTLIIWSLLAACGIAVAWWRRS